MDAERPEKATVRALWRDVAREIDQAFPGASPLYLTLSGAEGRDIELFVGDQLVRTTEVGGIASSDERRIIAVETSAQAVLKLQRRFPGLKILERPIQDLIRSSNPLRWPEGEDVEFCRARIVNLDINVPLRAVMEQEQIAFPILLTVRKFAQLHAMTPQLDWVLCLTLHGEITWDANISRGVQDFLRENFQREPQFAAECRKVIGESVCDLIQDPVHVDFSQLPRPVQQAVLMALVPKKLTELTVGQGWRLETRRNLRYGGTENRAPMVTWIIDFKWEPRASTTPSAVYLESLRGVLKASGQIAANGNIC